MRARILAVTADADWSGVVARALSGLPHRLESAAGAAASWDAVAQGRADLLLLDVDLPSLERLGWFRLLRQTEAGRGVGAILAGSRRDDEEVAAALELGAEDFVAKTCEPAELAARIKAVLRRRSGRDLRHERALKMGAVTLDPSRRRCLVRGAPVALNAREFELLEALMRARGRVLSRAYLLETVWGMSAGARTRAVDVSVSRLRLALGKRGAAWVETVERGGYRFRDPAYFSR